MQCGSTDRHHGFPARRLDTTSRSIRRLSQKCMLVAAVQLMPRSKGHGDVWPPRRQKTVRDCPTWADERICFFIKSPLRQIPCRRKLTRKNSPALALRTLTDYRRITSELRGYASG